MLSKEDAKLPLDLKYGEFTLVKELGRGGEGIVALYMRVKDNTLFACKLEFPGKSNNTFLTEALFMKEAT